MICFCSYKYNSLLSNLRLYKIFCTISDYLQLESMETLRYILYDTKQNKSHFNYYMLLYNIFFKMFQM
jgi:hypothetical protein